MVFRSPLKVTFPVPVSTCVLSKRVACCTAISPISSLSWKMPLRPFTEMLPTEFVALSVNAVDWVEDVVLELAADAEVIAEAGRVMLISTESLWLPNRFPVAGAVALMARTEVGAAGGCTWMEVVLKSLFAAALLAALTFLMVVIVAFVALGISATVALPTWVGILRVFTDDIFTVCWLLL